MRSYELYLIMSTKCGVQPDGPLCTEEGYRSVHGTFKIPGNGTYSIENCGRDCHAVIRVLEGEGDNATHGDVVRHPSYDNSGLILDDTKLPIEVKR